MAWRIHGEVTLDGSQFKRELHETSVEVMEFFKKLALGAIGIESLEQAFHKTIEAAFEFGDVVSKGAERLGITTDEFQRLNYAAIVGGSSIDELSAAFDRLAKAKEAAIGNLSSESNAEMSAAIQSFERFGISIEDIQNKNPQQLFEEIAESVKKTGANAETTANLMELMGRNAGALIPTLQNLEENKGKAVIVSKEDIKTLDEVNEKSKAVTSNLTSMVSTLTAQVFKPIDFLSNFFYDYSAPTRIRDMLDQLNAQHEAAFFVANGYSDEIHDFRPRQLTPGEKKDHEDALKIEEQITEEKKRGALVGKTDEQKRLEYLKEIKDLEYQIKGAPFEGLSETETAKLKLQLQRLKNDLASLPKNQMPKIKSDSLIEVGNFLGTGAGASAISSIAERHLEVSKKQLEALDKIVENTASKTNFDSGIDFGG